MSSHMYGDAMKTYANLRDVMLCMTAQSDLVEIDLGTTVSEEPASYLREMYMSDRYGRVAIVTASGCVWMYVWRFADGLPMQAFPSLDPALWRFLRASNH